jgi:hypothetical protein
MEGYFLHNAARPLECGTGAMAVLVDEASMLDLPLAAALLNALPTNVPVQLVLVGAWGAPSPAEYLCSLTGRRQLHGSRSARVITVAGACRALEACQACKGR